MPRYARLHAPGALVHVIARFTNRQYRLVGPREREAFVARLARALTRADWNLLGYALMSNHVHLALVAGQAPPGQLLKPLHTAFACWLNRVDRTLGPVFAERATTVYMDRGAAGRLLSYIHNNPVRAGVVSSPEESTWTTHRAYLDAVEAAPWLDVERGLALCGLSSGPGGRAAFHRLVCSRSAEPRSAELSGAEVGKLRARVRQVSGMPVEVSSPALGREGESCAILLPIGHPVSLRWSGDLGPVLALLCERRGVTLEALRSRSREAGLVGARRLAVVVGCRLLHRPVQEVAGALGTSPNAASKLLRRGSEVLEEARHIVTQITAR